LIERHLVPAENVAPAAEAIQELAAIQDAEQAMDRARSKILGMADGIPAQAESEAAGALEAEGLQRVTGENRVEPFKAPDLDPLPTADDGKTVDLVSGSIKRNPEPEPGVA
jgi:hypothetical protein